jgi:RND family efflux transporter MFP subunit
VSIETLSRRRGGGLRSLAVASIAAASLLASGCRSAEEAPPAEIRPVRATTITPVAADNRIGLTGTVQAETEINQSFRVDGRLIERFVDVGDTVSAGQLIARLDPQNEESSLQGARAQLSGASAQLAEAQSFYSRMRELVVEDAVSRAQYEQAEARRKTAEAQVEAARQQVILAENRLGYTRLVSEVAGVVTARGPEPGEIVGAGRMVVQVAREGARDAVFDVPAQVMDSVPRQPEIVVALSDDPNITAQGRVREIAPRADPVTGTFAVRVRLENPPAAMRLGSTVTGRIQFSGELSVQLPSSALVRDQGRTAVWIFDQAAGTVSLRNIEVRSTDTSSVQVTSGLEPGDIVVTAGAQALRPGQKVRLLGNQS